MPRAPLSPKEKAKPQLKVRLKPAPSLKTVKAGMAKPKVVISVKPAGEEPSMLDLPSGVLLGAHTSTAGGVAQAITRAGACGFTAAQIFVKNNKQWFAGPLPDEEAKQFQTARKASGIAFFAHNSYLVNLASQDREMFATSIRAMIGELERAEALGLPFMVMHPGSHGGAGEEAGLQRIAQGLDEIARGTAGYRCRMALEITAGQGNALGYKLEHLGRLLEEVSEDKRFGVCLDTAHLYAAGYNVRSRDGYEGMVAQVEKLFGTRRVLGLHLNDSKVPLGKRVDRHAHLGEGEIGLDCFQWIAQDPRWASIPKVLETPKSEDMHEDIDNLRKLAPFLHR
jgi:deoxyribonuclease-4